MLFDEIKKICDSCGLVDEPDKSLSNLEISTVTPQWKITPPKYKEGDNGYSFCLTQQHVPEKYYDKGGTQLIYLNTFSAKNVPLFIKHLWLYIPTITHSNHLRFMQRVITNEIYRPDIIFNGIENYFIDFNDSKESFIPEIECDGMDDVILSVLKQYITNVATLIKTLQ